MEKQKKWNLKSLAVAGMLTAISLNSCDQAQDNPVAKDKDETNVSSLVNKLYAESNESEFDAFLKAYESLTPEELKVFQELRLEKMATEAAQEVAPANGRISNEQKAEIAGQIEETRNFLAVMDKQALTKYGQHINKLTTLQQGEIADATGAEVYGRTSASNENARVGQVQQCTRFTSNLANATETNNASQGYHYRGRADNDVDALICDFVFYFKGDYKKVRGERNIDKLLIRSFSSIPRRREIVGGYPNLTPETRLLFGGNRYIALYGAAGLNNAHLRVSNNQ